MENIVNQISISQDDKLQNVLKYINDNVSILDKRIADNVTILNQKILSEDLKLLQQIVNNSTVLENRILSNASEIQQRIADNITIINNKFSQAILNNFTILDQRILNNVTAINQSLISGNNILLQNIIDNSTRLDQRILLNISSLNALIANTTTKLTQNILDNTTNLDKRISENITNVNSAISSGNFKLLQNIVDNSTTLDSRIVNNITSLTYNFTQNITTINTLIQQLQIQIDLLQNKQDKLPLEMLANMFQQENYEVTELWMVCGQPAYVQTFDITSVTNTIIASNFTNGSVFGSLINVQSAFIDIQGGVYTSVVQPLFAAQNQFYNIKVQVGTQIVVSGQILSSNNAIIINQFIILSKVGSTIMINSQLQLNILQTQSVNTNIKDMKVNLDVESSTGNLGLIGSLTGQMNIINYDIFGTYETQGSISMGASTLSSSNVMIKHLNFAPLQYVYGNQSSYLFRFVIMCNIEITRSVIRIGNINQQLAMGSISSTINSQQEFGGLILQMTSTKLLFAEIFYSSNLTCTTQYMTKSGLLLGITTSMTSQIMFYGICIQVFLNASTNFNTFGIFGQVDGNITFRQSDINIDFQNSATVNIYGIFGQITVQSIYSSFSDLTINQQINQSPGGNNAGLVGLLYSLTSNIQNISLSNSMYNNTCYGGGLLGIAKSNVSLSHIQIHNLTINSTGNSGTIIGQSVITVYMQNIIVDSALIESTQYVGGFIAFSDSNIYLYNSKVTNTTVISSQNLGGIIGFIQFNRQTIVQNVDAKNITIVSLAACSTGTIIGIATQGTYIQINIVAVSDINISANGGGGTAGIVGWSYYNITISSCSIHNIVINSTSAGTGGIIGQSNVSSIDNCQLTDIQLIAHNQAGGFVGILNWNTLISRGQVCNINIFSKQSAGGLIGISKAVVQISYSQVNNSNISSLYSVGGGFIGMANSTIIDQCAVNNTSIISGTQAGGLIGITYTLSNETINISNVSIINISLKCQATFSVGGIIGITYIDTQIKGAYIFNTSVITAYATGIGGVVGYSLANVSLLDISVDRLIVNSNAEGSGGIIGYSNITSCINCQVKNSIIISTRSNGGVIGFQISNITIVDSQVNIYNTSVQNVTLSSDTYAGGLIGFYNSFMNLQINMTNISSITVKSNKGGVLIGQALSTNYIITNSGSYGVNIVNDVVQSNCIYFIPTTNIQGC
ncbi:Conserved_hypothetical protein [Hexamita inflata]|uniref:Uncharacterized protein n=1 Tax=Hexamita inflata TaxID=28002 RepID=A0AA86N6F8_9EUKA|nr:Conserved hypothetical protein [Hexamita inflata]